MHSLNTSNVPAGAMLAFRATSCWGNNLWLDDIELRAGKPAVGVAQLSKNLAVTIYPNPAKEMATLTFSLESSSQVAITILDNIGRTISKVANQSMAAGIQTLTINTSDLASGAYFVLIRTDSGAFTQALHIVR